MRIVRYSRQGDVGFGILEGEDVAAIGPHPFGAFEYTGDRFPAGEVRLLAPVLPSKVVAVGRNYAEHARELGNEVPPEPVLFLKPSTSVIGPGDPIVRPKGWPGRLRGRAGRGSSASWSGARAAEAIQAVLGFTCANDVTARDLQRADGQWTRGKGFDTFCPSAPGSRPTWTRATWPSTPWSTARSASRPAPPSSSTASPSCWPSSPGCDPAPRRRPADRHPGRRRPHRARRPGRGRGRGRRRPGQRGRGRAVAPILRSGGGRGRPRGIARR